MNLLIYTFCLFSFQLCLLRYWRSQVGLHLMVLTDCSCHLIQPLQYKGRMWKILSWKKKLILSLGEKNSNFPSLGYLIICGMHTPCIFGSFKLWEPMQFLNQHQIFDILNYIRYICCVYCKILNIIHSFSLLKTNNTQFLIKSLFRLCQMFPGRQIQSQRRWVSY